MSLVYPWALWFLAGVPVIVALYFLKIRRRRLEVPSLLLWKSVLEENRRRALFHKLRHPLSLLLSLLLFLLVLLTLGRPVWERIMVREPALVLVLDARAGMGARPPGGPSRFDRAREEALRLVRNARGGTRFSVVAFAGDAPKVLCGLTPILRDVEAALRNAAPTGAGGDAENALELAGEIAKGAGGSVVLFTDRPVASDNVRVIPAGSPLPNRGITRFETARSAADTRVIHVFLEVANFQDHLETLEVEVRSAEDERLLDVRTFELQPGEVASKTFLLPPGSVEASVSDVVLHASLTGDDALGADNHAYAIVPATRLTRVLLVSSGSWFLEKLFAAGVAPAWDVLEPDSFRPEMAQGFDVVVFHDFAPEGWDWTNVSKGNYLFVGAWPGAAAPPEEPAETFETEQGSSLLRFVNLETVRWWGVPELVLPTAGGWRFETPARAADRPLLITGERRLESGERQRVAGLPASLTRSDLPLRVAFPLLINNALQWLSGNEGGVSGGIAAGPVPNDFAGQDWKPVDVGTPHVMGPGFWAPGIYQAEREGGSVRRVAVNIQDAAALDLRSGVSREGTKGGETSITVPFYSSQPLWIWLGLCALALFIAEWRLYHLRKTE